jgi:sugar phosphate permease
VNRKRNVLNLILNRSVSLFGAGIYSVSLPLYLLQETGSLAQAGIFFAAASLPSVLLLPFLGVPVERSNRKRVLVLCDFTSSAVFFSLLLLSRLELLTLPVLAAAGMLLNTISGLFGVASNVIFTELNEKESLEQMNGLKSFSDNLAGIASPLAGAYLFGAFGFASVLAAVGASYALSAAGECFIRYRRPDKIPGESVPLREQFLGGVRVITSSREIFSLFFLVMVLNFFVANSDEIINPGILVQKYGLPQKLYGLSSSSFVAGTLAAGLFLFRRKNARPPRLKALFLLNSAVMMLIGAASLLCYNLCPRAYFPIFLTLEAVCGFLTTCINVPLISSFQIQVPVEYQGRFFALLSFASGLLVPLGVSWAGLLSDRAGADAAYLINNACVILAVLFAYRKRKSA